MCTLCERIHQSFGSQPDKRTATSPHPPGPWRPATVSHQQTPLRSMDCVLRPNGCKPTTAAHPSRSPHQSLSSDWAKKLKTSGPTSCRCLRRKSGKFDAGASCPTPGVVLVSETKPPAELRRFLFHHLQERSSPSYPLPPRFVRNPRANHRFQCCWDKKSRRSQAEPACS